VKRLLREVKEMELEKNSQYCAAPLDDNLFEWHFTIRGTSDTDFEGGVYHGRIILPADYPFKPPNFVLLTPNGRFEIGKKICLSISAHHPEQWQPGWSIRTALIALIGFMPTKGDGAIGALDYTPEERVELAKKSMDWVCPTCGSQNSTALPEETEEEKNALPEETEEEENALPSLLTSVQDKQISKQILKFTPKEEDLIENINQHSLAEADHISPQDISSMSKSQAINTQSLQRSHSENPTPNVTQIQSLRMRRYQHESSVDYIIIALVVAIIALLIKKFFW